VVQTAAGAIVSLVSVVYTAGVEAATFIAHLAREAADIGGQLLARAAATLVSIGKLILSILETLWAWIVAEVRALLSPPVNQAISVRNQAATTETNSIVDAQAQGNQTGGGTNITQQSAAGVEQGWSTAVFEIGEVLGALLVIAIGIIIAFAGPASFVSNLLLGLVLSAIATTIVTITIWSIGSLLVWWADGMMNATNDAPGSYQAENQGGWKVFANTMGWYSAGLGVGQAAVDMKAAGFPGTPVGWKIFIAFVFAWVGLIFALAMAPLNLPFLIVPALIIAFGSMIIDLLNLPGTANNPVLRTAALATLGMDGASIAVAIADSIAS
jgi:hypothetical protein